MQGAHIYRINSLLSTYVDEHFVLELPKTRRQWKFLGFAQHKKEERQPAICSRYQHKIVFVNSAYVDLYSPHSFGHELNVRDVCHVSKMSRGKDKGLFRAPVLDVGVAGVAEGTAGNGCQTIYFGTASLLFITGF